MSDEQDANILRAIPSIDSLLRTDAARALLERHGAAKLTAHARRVAEEMREELRRRANETNGRATHAAATLAHKDKELARDDAAKAHEGARASLLDEAVRRLAESFTREEATKLSHVINATGVVLHTNLGRAPLSDEARRAVSEEAARYCTLEYDLRTGERGRRGARVEALLAEVTRAEAALVVNNCAAASLLILSTLAKDGETIVSRGELVEIGGDFRVPDVMATSGARMIEVGTTNRTKLQDYERAFNERTRMILRVHPSNYRIVGFTASPTLAELAALAHRHDLLLFEDAGSGALEDLSDYGLADEPVIKKSIADGADIVAFSGDKLLGGAQAGLIVGRAEIIERLRRSPLYRALRVDKLILAALQATLESHARGRALAEIPALRMIATQREEIDLALPR